MALLIPRQGLCKTQTTLTSTTTEFGTSVSANASAHTKTTTPVELLASSAFDAFGIVVGLGNVGTAAGTNTRTLVDIMVGGGGSEIVLIPDLMCGQAGESAGASSGPVYYYFPIYIPAGTRLSARSQSVAGSDTVHVSVALLQNQIAGKWYGSRVTAYGPSTATSTGVSHTPSTVGSYATTTQINAAIANRIKAMQIGVDLFTGSSGASVRHLVRIAAGSSTNYVVEGLPIRESTTLESVDFNAANLLLSQMNFDIPSGSYLGVGAGAAHGVARGYAIYGVD